MSLIPKGNFYSNANMDDTGKGYQGGVPTRPQIPQESKNGMTRWKPGELPKGGFRAVIDFSETPEYNTKKSPTSGGGGKVY